MALSQVPAGIELRWHKFKWSVNFLGSLFGLITGVCTIFLGAYATLWIKNRPGYRSSLIYFMFLTGLLLITLFFLYLQLISYEKRESAMALEASNLGQKKGTLERQLAENQKNYYEIAIRMRCISLKYAEFLIKLE